MGWADVPTARPAPLVYFRANLRLRETTQVDHAVDHGEGESTAFQLPDQPFLGANHVHHPLQKTG